MQNLNQQSILNQLSDVSRSQLTELAIFDTIDSTNQWLINNNACRAVCVAEQQTAGRGRRGHTWESEPLGNIYFSLSWCLSAEELLLINSKLSLLSLLVGLELCDVLESFGLKKHGMKWPNDIFIEGKKLAGVLVEITDNMHRLVIGVGINVEQCKFSADLNATSLALELNEKVNRNSLIGMLIERLFNSLSQFSNISYHDILCQWNYWDLLKGREVSVHNQSSTLRGLAMGINAHGELQLLLNNGNNITVNAAEVSVKW